MGEAWKGNEEIGMAENVDCVGNDKMKEDEDRELAKRYVPHLR